VGHDGSLVQGWQSAVFDLSNPGPSPVKIRLGLEVQNNSLVVIQQVEQEVDLPPGARQRQVLRFFCPQQLGGLTASARVSGRELLPEPMRDFGSLRPVLAGSAVLVLAGPSANWMQEIAGVSVRVNYGTQNLEAFPADGNALPDDAEGYGRLRAIVLCGFPFETLSSTQLEALTSWIASGGNLVLTAGPQGIPPALAERIKPLKGYRASSASSFPRMGGPALSPFASTPVLDGKPAGVSYQPVPSSPLHHFPWGFGRVTVLLVDPSSHPFRGWPGMARIWEAALPDPSPAWLPSWEPPEDVVHTLRAGLSRGPSPGVVSLLVLVYVLAIGPLQFMVLRRLKRSTWTLAVIPSLALLFTGVVLLLGYATLGQGPGANLATLRIVLPGGGGELKRTFVSVFSPLPGRQEIRRDTPGTPPLLLVRQDRASQEDLLHTLQEGSRPALSYDARMWTLRAAWASGRGTRPAPGLIWRKGLLVNAGTETLDRVLILERDGKVLELASLAPGETADPAKGLLRTTSFADPERPFEAAFLNWVMGQTRGGRCALGLRRSAEDSLLEIPRPPAAPLSIVLVPAEEEVPTKEGQP